MPSIGGGHLIEGNTTTMNKTFGVLCATAALVAGLTACEVPEDKASQDTSASQQEAPAETPAGETKAPEKKKPVADNSSKGKGAMTWGNWEVVGKLQVKEASYGSYDAITRVKNIGDSPDEGIFTITILKGDEILGTADCTTSTVAPGAVGVAECFSSDDFVPGWTELTIEDAF